MKQHIQTGAVITLLVTGIVLAVLLVIKLAPIVLIVLIAIVITNGIAPIVRRLQETTAHWWRMPRVVATLIILLAILLVFVTIIATVAVTAVNEAVNFSANTWPKVQDHLLHWASALSQRFPIIPPPNKLIDRLSTQSTEIGHYLWSTTLAVFGFLGGLFLLVTAFFMTFFFTVAREGIAYTLRQFIPPPYQQRVMDVSQLASEKMGGWLRGQVTLALIIAAVIMLGMATLQVPYAALLGLIGGMGELVPMVGPYLAFIPAILVTVSLGGPLWQVIAVPVFFIALAQIEGYILVPTIMKRHVQLNPVTTLLALLAGGTLLGLVGALLAIPLAAAGRVILLEAVFPAIQGKSRTEIEQGLQAVLDEAAKTDGVNPTPIPSDDEQEAIG